jgi:hypothetical protein
VSPQEHLGRQALQSMPARAKPSTCWRRFASVGADAAAATTVASGCDSGYDCVCASIGALKASLCQQGSLAGLAVERKLDIAAN